MANMTKWSPAVFVFGTVSLSALLWFERPNKVPQVQDVATLLAKKEEIETIAYSSGTNDPSWSSNIVSSVPDWNIIYTKILCGTRDMLTLPKIGRSYLGLDFGLGHLLWLDPTISIPVDGDILCSSDADWYLSSTNTPSHQVPTLTYSLSEPSNTVAHIPTTESRKLSPNFLNMMFIPDGYYYDLHSYRSGERWLDETNVASFARLIYGDRETNETEILDYAWSGGSIWYRIGLGTNIYKYSCEFFEKPELKITPLAGVGFSNISTNYTIQDTETKTITLKFYVPTNSISTNTISKPNNPSENLYSKAYKAYHPSAGEIGFVVADEQKTTYSNKYAVIVKNSSGVPTSVFLNTENTFKLFSSITNPIISLEALGSGIWVSPTIVTSNNIAHDIYFSIDNGCAGVIQIKSGTWTGYIGVINTNGWSGNSMFTVDPKTLKPFDDKSVDVQITKKAISESVTNYNTLRELKTNRQLTTNGLNDAKIALSALTRSVCVLENYYTSYKGIEYEYAFSTNEQHVSENPLYQIRANYWNTQYPLDTVISNSENRYSAHVDIAETAYLTQYDYGGDTYYENYAGFNSRIKIHPTSVLLPYPSKYACESGYVSKVTVFGIFHSKISRTLAYPYLPSTNEYASYTGVYNVHPPQDYNDRTLDICTYLCPYPDLDVSWSDSGAVDFNANLSYLYLNKMPKIILSKIAEFSGDDCKKMITVNIGTNVCPVISESWADTSFITYQDTPASYPIETHQSWVWATYFEIYLDKFVIIVDWNWSYLNDDE